MTFCSALRARFYALLLVLPLAKAFVPVAPAQDSINEPEIRAQMAIAEQLLGKTPDRGAILYFLAATHAQLQEPVEAMAKLKQCLALKEGFDPSGEPSFAALKESKEYKELVEQVRKDLLFVSTAKPAFTTIEKDLVPEGFAYDAVQDVFYLSSMHRKKIVQITSLGKIADFVPGDRYGLLPILGIRTGTPDGSIWANSWMDNGKTELLHFDKSGTLLARFAPPEDRKHGLNDLIVLRDGSLLITDTTANLLYRFDAKSHTFSEVKLSRELLQPNGIALTDDGRIAYVADQLGVIRLDVSLGKSTEVDPGPKNTLAGADGLYWHKDRLIAVQNGIGTPRIAVFQLSGDGLRVLKTTILEYRTRFTALPTTGALKGDDFYFIENSQLDNLNGDRILDATKLEPVRIGKVRIP